MRILLAGSPNCGKTTLFNALTGERARVGNRIGVTVEVRSARMRRIDAELWDLPGLYTFAGGSADEQAAREALTAAKPDLIVNVVDATRLGTGLLLTMELAALGVPMVVALNMSDECKKRGIRVDSVLLSSLLGVPAVPIAARTGEGLPTLLAALKKGGHLPAAACRRCRNQEERRRLATECYTACVTGTEERPIDAPDAVLTHPLWGTVSLLAIMASVFLVTFGAPGQYLSDLVGRLFAEVLQPWLSGALAWAGAAPWLSGLLMDGLFRGVSGVLAFLPQIALLFVLLTILEDSGYLSRAALLADGALSAIGLDGKAVVPLLMGFGCTVPAAMAARTLDSPGVRRRALLLIPFVPCSAKLPVFLFVAKCTFGERAGLAVAGMYLLSVTAGLLSALIARPSAERERAAGPFLLELPPYRLPSWRNVLNAAGERVTHFLSRAGTLILLLSLVLWVAGHITPTGAYTADVGAGVWMRAATCAAPLLRPVGLGVPEAAAALLAGFFAREAAVSALLLLSNGASVLFTPAQALSFLVLIAVSPPCAAALLVSAREYGRRRAFVGRMLLRFGYAYALAYAVYRLATLAGGGL